MYGQNQHDDNRSCFLFGCRPHNMDRFEDLSILVSNSKEVMCVLFVKENYLNRNNMI
jgi:hypothetical protein